MFDSVAYVHVRLRVVVAPAGTYVQPLEDQTLEQRLATQDTELVTRWVGQHENKDGDLNR